MMVRKIEFCVSNLDKGSQYVWDKVAEHYPKIKLRRWGCLGYCKDCIRQPYVLMDDKLFLAAEDEEQLWAKVERKIQRDNQELSHP